MLQLLEKHKKDGTLPSLPPMPPPDADTARSSSKHATDQQEEDTTPEDALLLLKGIVLDDDLENTVNGVSMSLAGTEMENFDIMYVCRLALLLTVSDLCPLDRTKVEEDDAEKIASKVNAKVEAHKTAQKVSL
jgi:hypothetical protein